MRKPKRPDHRRRKPQQAKRQSHAAPAARSRSHPRSGRRWSAEVTRTSDALDLERDVFNKRTPAAIAKSLKRSAEQSSRRKSPPFRSAMSMLTFYINRAGKNLSAARLDVLQRTKGALRKAFGRS
jgi:hypothetical protein